jgi:hypothetical protein
MAKGSGKTTFIVFIMFMMCLSSIVAAGGLYVTSKEKVDGTTLEIRSEATNIAVLPRPSNIVGRYNATSLKNDKWEDLSGKANHISADKIKGTLSKSEGFKGAFVKGTTSDGFTLPQVFDNKNWSFFAVARYGSDQKQGQGRIFVSGDTENIKVGDNEYGKNWLIGHYSGQTGVAHYGNPIKVNDESVAWITKGGTVHGKRPWIRMVAQHNYFGTNGKSRTTGFSFDSDTQKKFNNPKSIGINVGTYAESEPSDWNVYEILVYDVTLDVVDREKVDTYLKEKYILADLKSGVEIAGGRPKIIGDVKLSVDEDKSEPWYGGKQRFGTQEDCRRFAQELGYPQWGHYNEKYSDEAKRNTCFFYGTEIVEISEDDQLKTDGETGVDDMTFGCTQPYRDPKLMCEAGSGSGGSNVTGGVAADASGAYCKAIKKVNDSSDIDRIQAVVCGKHCTKSECMDPSETFRLGQGGASYKLDEYCVWNNTPDFETFYNPLIKDEDNAPLPMKDISGNNIPYLQNHLSECTNFKYEVEGANTNRILKDTPETSRSASSVYDDDPIGTGYGKGRLDSIQAWSAKNNTVGEWYQIDNGKVGKISGIAMKGRTNTDQWVKTYKVMVNGVHDTWVDVDGGKEFTGNTNSGTQVNAIFETPVEGRYVRIYPQTWNSHMSMRADIYVGTGEGGY